MMISTIIINSIHSPSLKDKVAVDVEATEEIDELTYLIIARGNAVVSKTLRFTKAKKFSFDFDVTFAMLPQAHLVVSYFSSAGELVFDENLISFASELPNYVS